MNCADGLNTIVNIGDLVSMRWLFGEYEKAIGSAKGDLLLGNLLSNNIKGGKLDHQFLQQRLASYAGQGRF